MCTFSNIAYNIICSLIKRTVINIEQKYSYWMDLPLTHVLRYNNYNHKPHSIESLP